jgi:hypothetical protein
MENCHKYTPTILTQSGNNRIRLPSWNLTGRTRKFTTTAKTGLWAEFGPVTMSDAEIKILQS